MKKIISIALCFAFVLSFFGCSNRVYVSSSTGSGNAEYEQYITETTVEETESTERETEKATEAETVVNETTETEATTSKESEQSSERTQHTEANQKKETHFCTIEIECTEILSHMDRLAAGHEELVPADGIMLNTLSVEIEDGDTAYDVLVKACNKSGILINEKSTVYGKYIAGLNNIDEKDCGRNSGWLYSINGVYPAIACSSCNVKSGDSIVFRYTCG